MTITARGRELAKLLHPFIGTTTAILETCSLIARHARTHAALQEAACNRELTRAEVQKDKRIEARIRTLVATLPHFDHGPITVKFDGDPRGFTVKLVVPRDERGGNTWGLGGEYGV